MSQIDYKKVFSKLSHIKALSHDHKFDQIVQNIIVYSLVTQINKKLTKESDVSQLVADAFGITIRNSVIQSNLDKLLTSGDIYRDSMTKSYTLKADILLKTRKRIEDSNNLEIDVKNQWFEEIRTGIVEIEESQYENLWDCLKKYLCNVFEQHGIQTLHILNPSAQVNEDDQKSFIIMIENIIKETDCPFTKEILSRSVNQFINNATELRVNYISQLADATFTSYALTSDAETVNFLNSRYNSLLLFLDTNFIFGVLDLHKNTEDASAREILEEVKENKMPFKLTFHPETLSEFKRAFDQKALLIKATKWSMESSRVALQLNNLSPLEKLFHQENVKSPIDPSVFLDKYNHVDLILSDLGLTEYSPNEYISDLEHGEIDNDIKEYQNFYEATPNRKLKSYSSFRHDIVVLREVRSLNPKKSKFLDSNAFFISSDFILSKFEKIYYKKIWEINYVVSPSIFLQLIRPFIQSDYTSNKRFIDTFSIPEFRSFEIDYTSTRSKALQIINDNYHNTSFETKVKILRDQVLLEKLSELNDRQEKQVALIEKQIALENNMLAKEKENALKDAEKHLSDKQLMENEKKKTEKEKEEIEAAFQLKTTEYEELSEKYKALSSSNEINHKKELLNLIKREILSKEIHEQTLEKIIRKKDKNHKAVWICIPVFFYSILLIFIYNLGWTKMEPITYVLSIVFFLSGYIYLIINGENFNPLIYFGQHNEKVRTAIFEKFQYDPNYLKDLKKKKNEIESELSSIEHNTDKKIEDH